MMKSIPDENPKEKQPHNKRKNFFLFSWELIIKT